MTASNPTDTLLPCPFCGGDATVGVHGKIPEYATDKVGCSKCNVWITGSCGWAELQAERWNTRADIVPQVADKPTLENMRKLLDEYIHSWAKENITSADWITPEEFEEKFKSLWSKFIESISAPQVEMPEGGFWRPEIFSSDGKWNSVPVLDDSPLVVAYNADTVQFEVADTREALEAVKGRVMLSMCQTFDGEKSREEARITAEDFATLIKEWQHERTLRQQAEAQIDEYRSRLRAALQRPQDGELIAALDIAESRLRRAMQLLANRGFSIESMEMLTAAEEMSLAKLKAAAPTKHNGKDE
jgi:hypothetical protein